MKDLTKKLVAGMLLAATSVASVACGGTDANKNKATLYVYSFTSGFQTEWLTSLIADYEEVMKDVEIDGKVGLHIEPTTLKSDVTGSQMAGRDEVIYFLEQQDYYELLAGNYLADITEAVTGANPYDAEGVTLESKMFEDQKSYLGRKAADGTTRYYAYPHYFTNFGIVYDIDLFDSKGYYFADGYKTTDALENIFVGKEDWDKSAGPDGVKGNSDDGLPTTYEEFLLLCDYINNVGNDNPLIWTGQYHEGYLTHFLNALAADYEGYEQMRLNFTFDGEAKNLGKIVNGEFVKDETTTVIDGLNGAELARQAGKYYAIDFYSDLYQKSYINAAATKDTNVDTNLTLYSSSYSHIKAQEDFLKRSTRRNAMLLEGSWWMTEATPTFDAMKKMNAAYSKENRKLGWMPLPKQSAELVGTESTLYDVMYPLLMMKNGLDQNSWQYKYALDFIQFANSDAQLAKFTKITNCTKALNYRLSDDDYNALTPYGKTFYDSYVSSKIVFPYANNLLFANNQNIFKEMGDDNGSPLYRSKTYPTYPTKAIEKGISADSYFSGIYEYFKELAIWKKVN